MANAPKRQLGDQTKHERSTKDLPKAGEDRGMEGNTPPPKKVKRTASCPGVNCHKGELTQYRRMPGNQPVIIRKFEQGESQNYQRASTTRQPGHPILMGKEDSP